MNYLEFFFKIEPKQPATEILIAELNEIGFESFVEVEEGLKAYIQENEYQEKPLKALSILNQSEFKITYDQKIIADQNWNAKWESEYEPVIVNDRCYIRAPFHPTRSDVEFEIEIEPQMSFGTAHHETTYQMIQLLMDEDLKGLSVLDMGCGTAVLAILAALKDARTIDAIDNDEWAYNNACENVKKNHFPNIKVLQGDVSLLQDQSYEIIIANINKNILLRDMGFYKNVLAKDGKIFFSGFYEKDLIDIQEKAEKLSLKYSHHVVKNNWVAAVFLN